MNYAKINKHDVANGPGVRVTIWVTGCGFRCPGCFNKEAWNPNFGTPFTEKTLEEILKALEPNNISGLTILGGEPLFPTNILAVSDLCRKVKEKYGNTKSIWMWTGNMWDYVLKLNFQYHFLENIDVVVDGLFDNEKKDLRLKYAGSTNQRVIKVQETFDKGYIVEIDNYK